MKISFRSQKQLTPEQESHVLINYADAKRKAPRFRWYLIILVIISPFIYVLFDAVHGLITVDAIGYVSYNKTTIRTAHDGFVKAIYVKNGDSIKKGQMLVQLQDPKLEGKQLALKSAMLQYQQMKNAQVGDVSTALLRKLAVGELAVKFHEAQMAIVQKLRDEHEVDINDYAIAQQQLLDAQLAVESTKVAIAQLQAEKAQTLMTPGSYLNQGEQLQQQQQALLLEAKLLKIHAPANGKIIDIYSSVGEFLPAGSPLLLETAATGPTVSAFLDPKYGQYTHRGQKVTIQFPTGKKIKGIVISPPKLTKLLPLHLTDATDERKIMIVVVIKPLQAIPNEQDLEGLPVTVNFSLHKAESSTK